MSAHTRTHPTEHQTNILNMQYNGDLYQFPIEVAKKYRVEEKNISADKVFKIINEKYTKAGALLAGVRFRENLTQVQMAKKLKVTQSDISQMENGKRKIGRIIAKRIAKLFGTSYESFLSTSNKPAN